MFIKHREKAWGPSASSEVQGAKGEKTESCEPEAGGRAQEQLLPPSTCLSLQQAWAQKQGREWVLG